MLLTVREENLEEGEELSDEEREEFKEPIHEKYEEEGNPYHSAAKLWDDGVIDPVDPGWSWPWDSPPPPTPLSSRRATAVQDVRAVLESLS